MDKRNPYPLIGTNGKVVGWRWRNEHGVASERVYQTEDRALFALLTHLNKMPWWKRLWQRMRGSGCKA